MSQMALSDFKSVRLRIFAFSEYFQWFRLTLNFALQVFKQSIEFSYFLLNLLVNTFFVGRFISASQSSTCIHCCFLVVEIVVRQQLFVDCMSDFLY